MPRIPIVAGNWKMNTTAATARALVEGIRAGADSIAGVEKIVFPPFPFLADVAAAARGSTIGVGAQNMHWEEKGAFTGEVSAPMLAGLGQYVLIGHSERRAYFAETDETVSKKLRSALAAGLTPVVCVGETGAERQADLTQEVLERQVAAGIEKIPGNVIVAYEPVWAIGTGLAATVEDANGATGFIRRQIAKISGDDVAAQVRILYDGSVTPENIAEFVAQP